MPKQLPHGKGSTRLMPWVRVKGEREQKKRRKKLERQFRAEGKESACSYPNQVTRAKSEKEAWPCDWPVVAARQDSASDWPNRWSADESGS